MTAAYAVTGVAGENRWSPCVNMIIRKTASTASIGTQYAAKH